jgi:hypothetical protein
MKNRFLFLLPSVALLAAVGDSVSAPAAAGVAAKLPDNVSPTFPRVGVDHVVTYAAWRGWGPKGGDRVVLFRHAALIRTETDYIGSKRAGEATHGTAFSNLAAAAALEVGRDRDGSLLAVSFSRGGLDDIPIYRHSIAATDASETIAGERCTVWLARPETNEGVSQSACITRDGVVLRETVLFRDGSVMNERRATKVERRRVRPEEVSPPADALRWAAWAAAASEASSGGDASNYELTLVAMKEGKPFTEIMRKAGDYYSEEERTDSAVRSLGFSSSAATLSYNNRTHPKLTISRSKASTRTGVYESAPLTKPAETVIGERCTWYDAAANVADYGRLECRSADHLPLIRNEYFRGRLRVSWLATKLSRGRTSPESVKPPAWLLNWTFWGWPQLAGP